MLRFPQRIFDRDFKFKPDNGPKFSRYSTVHQTKDILRFQSRTRKVISPWNFRACDKCFIILRAR